MKGMRARLAAFFAETGRVFAPPFPGLPVVLWAYFVIAYIAFPVSPVWHGALPDPDDYTYLSQTLDWLSGQGWYDNVQHRMGLPPGVAIHYTRFAELPVAGLVTLLRAAFGIAPHGAALLASFILPLVYLALLFIALRWAAAPFAGAKWARLSCAIILFMPPLMFKFAPGQVDHHGLEAILTVAALGCLARLFATERVRWAALGGLVAALALAVALETLPWAMLFCTSVGLWCAWRGRAAARPALAFGLVFFAASAGLLALDRPPATYFGTDLLSYSFAYVLLAGGAALAIAGAASVARLQNIGLRCALAAIWATALGAVYLWHFPALLAGPYGAMDPKLAALFFGNLEEALPLFGAFPPLKIFAYLLPPLLGLGASLYLLRREKEKFAWGLLAALLAAASALAAFYQVRVILYAELFAAVALTAFVARGWAAIGARYAGRRRFWAEIGLLLLAGPLAGVLLPALVDGRPFNTGVLLFPAQGVDQSCSTLGLQIAESRPTRIVNFIDAGPELLFRGGDDVMSAPYHTNVRGNLDALAFFTATGADKAHALAERDGIGLVVMCRLIPDMYFAAPGPHYLRLPGGRLRMRPDPGFAAQLAEGHAPGWLKPLPAPPNLLVFAVRGK